MSGGKPAKSRWERTAAHARAPRRSWGSCLVGLLAILATGVHASDHGIALAYPLDGSRIQVDGDLSEWPTHLPRYAIRSHLLLAQPVDAEDFSAEFRIAYDEAQAVLYVAIEVQDADRGDSASGPLIFWPADVAYVWVRVPEVGQRPTGALGFSASVDAALQRTMLLRGRRSRRWRSQSTTAPPGPAKETDGVASIGLTLAT